MREGRSSLHLSTDGCSRFACNAHTICDEELKPVGMGLFVVNSLANHDCEPNAIILYDGPNAVMRAIREIAAGTEVGLRADVRFAWKSSSPAELS